MIPVLFVHPESTWRETYSRALWELGFAVRTAATAAEARELMRRAGTSRKANSSATATATAEDRSVAPDVPRVVIYGGAMPGEEGALLAAEFLVLNPRGGLIFVGEGAVADTVPGGPSLAVVPANRALSELRRVLAAWRMAPPPRRSASTASGRQRRSSTSSSSRRSRATRELTA